MKLDWKLRNEKIEKKSKDPTVLPRKYQISNKQLKL